MNSSRTHSAAEVEPRDSGSGARPQTPAVSIIIPAFNREGLLTRALDSVVRQEFSDYEVIVIDDGSADDIEARTNSCGADNLRLIRHAHNRGAAAARNTGILAAKGRFIAFLDSDDEWDPSKLILQVTALENAPLGVRACVCGYRLLKESCDRSVSPKIRPRSYKSAILFGCTISPGSCLLVYRDVFDKIGMFDEELTHLEDWDWLLRFVEHYDMAFISDLLANIHVDNSDVRVARYDTDCFLQSIRKIQSKHSERIRARGRTAWRQFRSTILFETAAHFYRKGHSPNAVAYVIASLFVYPFRNISFFATLWRSVLLLALKPTPPQS